MFLSCHTRLHKPSRANPTSKDGHTVFAKTPAQVNDYTTLVTSNAPLYQSLHCSGRLNKTKLCCCGRRKSLKDLKNLISNYCFAPESRLQLHSHKVLCKIIACCKRPKQILNFDLKISVIINMVLKSMGYLIQCAASFRKYRHHG